MLEMGFEAIEFILLVQFFHNYHQKIFIGFYGATLVCSYSIEI